MQNNISDQEIASALLKKYNDARNRFLFAQAEYNKAKAELNNCAIAYNIYAEKPVPLVDDTQTKSTAQNEDEATLNSIPQPIEYKQGMTWKEKIVTVLKIHERALSKQEIAEYIAKRENKKIEDVKEALTSELFLLCDRGDLTKSKSEGITMKGYFYGHPSWLVKDGVWKKQYLPKFKPEQKSIW